MPRLAKAVYELTISATEISQGPRHSDMEGWMSRLSTPNS